MESRRAESAGPAAAGARDAVLINIGTSANRQTGRQDAIAEGLSAVAESTAIDGEGERGYVSLHVRSRLTRGWQRASSVCSV